MRHLPACLILCLALTWVGCSQMVEVKTDFDEKAEFDTFKTFDFMNKDIETMELAERWRLADEYIRAAIVDEMSGKGLNLDADNPDLLVAYSLGVRDKLGYTDFNVDYSKEYANAEIYSTAGGVFVLDLIDTQTDRLVWRGQAEGALNVDPSAEIMKKNVNNMVKKLFKQYPPGGKPKR